MKEGERDAVRGLPFMTSALQGEGGGTDFPAYSDSFDSSQLAFHT